MVTEAGRFGGPGLSESLEELNGRHCLTEGSGAVLDLLRRRSLLAHTEALVHSYPYDWRTGRPVMLRASSQWFLDTAGLRDRALTALDTVRILPDREAGAMRAFVAARPYWCISRQRVHGVPIPVLYDESTGDPVYDSQLTRRFAEHVAETGSADSWFELSADQLAEKFGSSELRHRRLKKSGDIFDIWMDSGLSWAVAGEAGDLDADGQASLCVEGQDQFRGWFSSSLLLSVALTGRPPYKSLAVHGFTVDETGRKMSKSVGNVVDPEQVILRHGPDGLRYWAASAGLAVRPEIGDRLLAAADGHVKRLRSHLRFLLGCVSDLPLSETVRTAICHPADAGYLALLADFVRSIEAAFDACDTGAVCRQLEQLLSQAAGPYLAAVKHRLYCFPADSPDRRSAQAALWQSLRAITMATAPVLPHLAEEVYAALPVDGFGGRPAESPTSVCLEAWQFPDLSDSSDSRTLLGRQLLALFRLRSAAFAGSDEFAQAASAAARLSLAPLSAGWELLLANDALPWRPEAKEDPRFGRLAETLRCSSVRVVRATEFESLRAADRRVLTDCDLGDVGVLVEEVRPDVSSDCPRCRRRVAKASAGDTCGDDELCQQCADFLLDGWASDAESSETATRR
ncbi:hypothetical protein BOX15_Mlig020645g1 [Macrostomum lignano]|nr:hypothetical protein BOX15_Mlig020645g1 [Macrostomum lignano]